MAIPDPIPVNPRGARRHDAGYRDADIQYEQPHYHVHRQPAPAYNGLENVPVPVKVVAIIFAIMMVLKCYGSAESRARKHHRQGVRSIAETVPSRNNVSNMSSRYSYLVLRSYPAGSTKIGRRKINTPARDIIKVRPGKRRIVVAPINPQLRKVEIVYDFTGGTKYQVMANCETGKYQIKKLN